MEIIEKGQCGERVSYELYEDGTLKIFGVGEMYNYKYPTEDSPFTELCRKIKKVVVSLGVTTIGNSAFYYCDSLVSVELSNSITKIGDSAFCLCSSLLDIDIPNSVTEIKSSAFSNCKSLKVVNLGNSIVTLDSCTFIHCVSLVSVNIPNSVIEIRDKVFSFCESLRFVDIPDSVTKIGLEAFHQCYRLDTIKIGQNVVDIEHNAFDICNGLTNIIVDERNKKYSSEKGVLYNKSKSVLLKYPAQKSEPIFVVPDSVEVIGQKAFFKCKLLKRIKMTQKVREIEDNALGCCEGLRIVDIDGELEKIGTGAFDYCYNIISLSIASELSPILEDKLPSIVETVEIRVPKNSIHYYRAARGWNRFTNYVAIEDEN